MRRWCVNFPPPVWLRLAPAVRFLVTAIMREAPASLEPDEITGEIRSNRTYLGLLAGNRRNE